MDPPTHGRLNALRTPGEPPTGRNTLATSSRLFEIALQATVANADATRAESDQSGSGIQSKRPSTYASQSRSVHLTPQQWQLLNDYHEHELFIRTRSWGFCLAIFGVGLALFGCGSPAWKWVGNVRHPYEIGLWAVCFPNNATCLSLIYYLQDDWKVHTSIICFLGCACLFGILGLGLATTGACRSALIPRLYYYHSAGECFLVSSVSTASSLVLYPISASACIRNLISDGVIKIPGWVSSDGSESLDAMQRYAYTYYLTWIAAVFFMSSFFCMNLDLLIQSFVRPVPFLSALANYLNCCQLHSAQSCGRTDRARSVPSLHSPNPRSGNQGASPVKPSVDVTKSHATTRSERNPMRTNPIPEILLSSYDEEASLDCQTDGLSCQPHRKQKRLSRCEDEIQGTGEDGDEEDDEEEEEEEEKEEEEDDEDDDDWI